MAYLSLSLSLGRLTFLELPSEVRSVVVTARRCSVNIADLGREGKGRRPNLGRLARLPPVAAAAAENRYFIRAFRFCVNLVRADARARSDRQAINLMFCARVASEVARRRRPQRPQHTGWRPIFQIDEATAAVSFQSDRQRLPSPPPFQTHLAIARLFRADGSNEPRLRQVKVQQSTHSRATGGSLSVGALSPKRPQKEKSDRDSRRF